MSSDAPPLNAPPPTGPIPTTPLAGPTRAEIAAAKAKLWRSGHIAAFKLDASQKELYKEIKAKRAAAGKDGRASDRVIVLAGRGWGKSFVDFVMLVETCLQGKPVRNEDGKITRYDAVHTAFVTKTKKQGVKNLQQTVDEVLDGCPKAVRPIWNKTDAEYIFKNGSTLSLVGVDAERYDFLRGRALDGCAVDEAQDIDNLDHIVKVILDPCVLRRGGWMVLTGTVPQRDTHDFVQFIREAAGEGNLVKRRTRDSPRYSPAQQAQMASRQGGYESNNYKREYDVELLFSDERQVISEWTFERAARLTRDQPRPEYCDKYVGLDFGFQRDLTVALFGYWDFVNTALVIEDEVTTKACTTAVLANLIETKLTELWGPAEQRPTNSIHLWADGNEPRTIHELKVLHKLSFKATDKKDKQMAINNVKILVATDKLVISPKAKTLLKTLTMATWNKHFNSYTREQEIGHADALDALCYLFRNVKQNKNPVLDTNKHWTMDGRLSTTPLSPAVKTLGSCFGNNVVDLRKAVAGKLGRRRF